MRESRFQLASQQISYSQTAILRRDASPAGLRLNGESRVCLPTGPKIFQFRGRRHRYERLSVAVETEVQYAGRLISCRIRAHFAVIVLPPIPPNDSKCTEQTSVRNQIAHSNRPKLTVLQPIGVPHLCCLHVAMSKKIPYLEDRCPHIQYS